MAYVGIRLEHLNGNVTVKLHGPTNKFNVNTVDLKTYVVEALTKNYINNINLMDMCLDVSKIIIEKYGNGDDIIWAEIEIETSNGVLVGASAEKVLVSS
jgi:hypothetical protein